MTAGGGDSPPICQSLIDLITAARDSQDCVGGGMGCELTATNTALSVA